MCYGLFLLYFRTIRVFITKLSYEHSMFLQGHFCEAVNYAGVRKHTHGVAKGLRKQYFLRIITPLFRQFFKIETVNIQVFSRIYPFHFHHPFANIFAVSISSQYEKRLFYHIRKNTEEMRKTQNRPKALYFQGFSDNLMFCLKAAEKPKPLLLSKKIQICASFLMLEL